MRNKKILIDNPELIINNCYYSQKNSTLLVGFVWVFMVIISFLGNSWVNAFELPVKSSIFESVITKQSTQNVIENITIWKQTVIIWWKEYTLDLSPNF